MTYQPPTFPVGLRPGSKTPSAKPLQAALKAAGYLSKLIPASDNYGALTASAVKRFHSANPAFGLSSDGAIGPRGWAFLFRKAYDIAVPVDGEPAHDYHRVIYGGKTVNVRTRTMLIKAQGLLVEYAWTPRLAQGSYNKGVAASAGTHDGGGCVDVAVDSMSPQGRLYCLKALRKAGFAAWIRTPAEGFSYHIHACAIGDKEMASVAKSQVRAYFAGRNGLASNGPDSAPASVGRPYPTWAAKYK